MRSLVQYENHHLGAIFSYQNQPYRLEAFLENDSIRGRAMLSSMKTLFQDIPYNLVQWTYESDQSIFDIIHVQDRSKKRLDKKIFSWYRKIVHGRGDRFRFPRI